MSVARGGREAELRGRPRTAASAISPARRGGESEAGEVVQGAYASPGRLGTASSSGPTA